MEVSSLCKDKRSHPATTDFQPQPFVRFAGIIYIEILRGQREYKKGWRTETSIPHIQIRQ